MGSGRHIRAILFLKIQHDLLELVRANVDLLKSVRAKSFSVYSKGNMNAGTSEGHETVRHDHQHNHTWTWEHLCPPANEGHASGAVAVDQLSTTCSLFDRVQSTVSGR